MGKKKSFPDSEPKENGNKKTKTDETEYAEMPPGWKEPEFTKADNPHGRFVNNIFQ